MEVWILLIFNNERKRIVNVVIEELECKYENIELIFFDVVKKGFLNVVFIILIFDELFFGW